MQTKSTPRRPFNKDPHIARRVAIGKRPISEPSSSDSLRSRKKQNSSPSPLEFAVEIQKKAMSRSSTLPLDRYHSEQSVISAKALAKLAKAHGFSHARVICAQEHQRADELGNGWCAWSRYNIQAGESLPLHP